MVVDDFCFTEERKQLPMLLAPIYFCEAVHTPLIIICDSIPAKLNSNPSINLSNDAVCLCK